MLICWVGWRSECSPLVHSQLLKEMLVLKALTVSELQHLGCSMVD